MMKKIATLILLLLFAVSLMHIQVHAFFRIEWDTRDTRFVEGVRHIRIAGTIDFNGVESRQVINYFGANPALRDDLHIIVGDNYVDYGWGMGNINTITYNIHDRYPHFTMVGGVNGDFYNMMTGHPVMAYIRNYEVLTPGLVHRTLLGFKEDGSLVAGTPCLLGHELIVFNEDGARKLAQPVARLNSLPANDSEIAVFFPNYQGTITSSHNKVVIDAMDIKLDGYDARYFGKGILNAETTGETMVPEHGFVIVGTHFNDDELITSEDLAIVQQKLGCGFEDVRYGIGAWEVLVEDGVPTTYLSAGAGPQYRHPRTALGITADGTIFFVTVDGRNKPMGMEGVTAYEMAEIMAHFGAVDAYNLDGGGSTTMYIKADDGTYETINTPSDGSLRRLSNALFFVKGYEQSVPAPVLFPDDRSRLDKPPHVHVDDEGVLRFHPVGNAAGYQVRINGVDIETEYPYLPLDLPEGEHTVRVRALGGVDFQNSPFSDTMVIHVYPTDINRFIELLKSYLRRQQDD